MFLALNWAALLLPSKRWSLFHPANCAVALCCILVAPLCFASDLKITERSATRGIPARTSTTYISGRRTRIESRSVSGFQAWSGGPTVFSYGHRTATIYQCDARRLIFLDLDAHEYMSVEIDEQGRPANPRPMGTPMPLQPSGATLTVNIEDIDTGERKVMFGYTARHIIRTERRVPGCDSPKFCPDLKLSNCRLVATHCPDCWV